MESKAITAINNLLDDNSFVEIGSLITARSTDFNDLEPRIESDGVITGHGLIDGSLVYVYAQNADVCNGTIGEMHAKKINNLYSLALKSKAPIIGFIDSKGVRLYESMDAIEAMGSIMRSAADASGSITQVLAITGTCGGGLNALSGISDYVVACDDSHMYINSPDTIDDNYTDKLDSSSASYRFDTGNVDKVCSIDEMPQAIRSFLAIAPDTNLDVNYDEFVTDDLNRTVTYNEEDDVIKLIEEIADDNVFVETKGGITSVITGLMRLAGQTVGVAANNSKPNNRLDVAGVYKMADFVNYCDAFNIPILTITSTNGFECDFATERSMSNALAKLTIALAQSTVGKINLITGCAYGSAYIFMNSKALGADIVYAYPTADIALMDADSAAKILGEGGGELGELSKLYKESHMGVDNAAKRGIVDRIVNPADTRKYLIDGFEILHAKDNYNLIKKHASK